MPCLAGGEHLDGQKKDGQIPHPGGATLVPVAGLPASAAARHCVTRRAEAAQQNYKKAAVFQLVTREMAGTARSVVPRCAEVALGYRA